MIRRYFRRLTKRLPSLVALRNFAGVSNDFDDSSVGDEFRSRWRIAAAVAAFSGRQLVESRYQQLAGGCEFGELHFVHQQRRHAALAS